MKKLIAVLVAVLMLVGSANVDGDGTTTPYHSTNVNTAAQLILTQLQTTRHGCHQFL